MSKPLCPICDTRHYPYQGHVFASQRRSLGSSGELVEPVVVEPVAQRATKEASLSKTKQRWDRGKYNEYMRGYMKKRRASGVKSSGA